MMMWQEGKTVSEVFEHPKRPSLADIPFEDRDYLHLLLPSIDWDMQLLAIRKMIRRNRNAGSEFDEDIRRNEEGIRNYHGPHADHYVDEHVYLMHQSVYLGATESMAAIGIIAPTIESIFTQAFFELGQRYAAKGVPLPEDKRWQIAKKHPTKSPWDCQCYFKSDGDPTTDIISGIRQLSRASGLLGYLSGEIWKWIKAMLSYRNYMLHGGLEWTVEKRAKFEQLIVQEKWHEYFTSSRTDGDPWIFYIRDDMVVQSPDMIENILDALADFVKGLPFALFKEPILDDVPDFLKGIRSIE